MCKFSAMPALVVSGMIFSLLSAWVEADDQVDFNRDVRPILSNHCWNCHGPDEHSREAGLRLDIRENAIGLLDSGSKALIPGNAQASELVKRVFSGDGDVLMPPSAFKRPLSQNQKETLKRWIDQGAPYAGHWAYTPPKRPRTPTVTKTDWPRNEIDCFVLARLEREGLTPSPPAEKGAWLRRVTLDLTGLPPSISELDAFLHDDSPQAKEAVVDRLLHSAPYAERMAVQWMDGARFADTNGYNNDEMRTMWPWRDWVIRAFATGMPYNQFITEQLAGDLLPNATIAQRVATGFIRNHVLTTEGGVIAEEYHIEYVADRVHTAATVFLAMSMQCARCHDHKFDPISQRDYYQFAGFFNNTPDQIVRYSQGRMAEPLLKVPSPEQEQALLDLAQRKIALERELKSRRDRAHELVEAWEKTLDPAKIENLVTPSLTARFGLDQIDKKQTDESSAFDRKANVVGEVKLVEGKWNHAFQFQGKGHIEAGQIGDFEGDQPFTLSAWIKPQPHDSMTILSKLDEADAYRGYDIMMAKGKIACHVIHQWPNKGFRVDTKDVISANEWHHIAVVYDGSRKPSGLTIYINGKRQTLNVTNDKPLDGTLKTGKPFHIGTRGKSAPFFGAIDEVQVFSTALNQSEIGNLVNGQRIGGIKELLNVPASERTESQQSELRDFFLNHVDERMQKSNEELKSLPAKVKAIEDAIPVTMVMTETAPRRKSYILRRGQYDQRGEEVLPGVPAALLPLPPGVSADRLGLARWLTHPDHPLTARVAINRWWEMFFGTGLVETTEDFGIQGTLPSHPELLDYLATKLIASRWDLRAILKDIALSATYGQSSHLTKAQFERDPQNRLLARGPRYRLAAETIRDHALFVSGLLNQKVGGPSVKPHQPDGLWEDVSVERREKYQLEAGDGIYRRSMYTFWKRTCPPPAMSTFDAPDRETCLIRRARTNTPLQALVMLNDPTYVESSRKLAERVMKAATNDQDRMTFAFRTVLSRVPTAEELKLVTSMRTESRKQFHNARHDAEKLLAVGRAAYDTTLDAADIASWTAVCSILLNLSEAVTKP